MRSGNWFWICKILLKSVLVGTPTLIALLFWKRSGVRSESLYRLGWANLAGYLTWLLAVVVVTPLSETQHFRWIGGSIIPMNLFFAIPFLAAIGSFGLCLSCIAAETGERRYPLLVNGLMLILWSSLVVPPN